MTEPGPRLVADNPARPGTHSPSPAIPGNGDRVFLVAALRPMSPNIRPRYVVRPSDHLESCHHDD